MGLDNGICIKRETASEKVLALFDDEVLKKYNLDLSVAYWRKCWNVRNVVFDLLKIDDFNDSTTVMSASDIKQVIVALKKLNRNNYCDYGDCAWDWKDFKRQNKKNIAKLYTVMRLMKKNDIEVYFYDSW